MDIARPDIARRSRLRRRWYGLAAVVGIAVVTAGVLRLQPSAPRVDRDAIVLDTVQRGPMIRQVRGLGKLVPEHIRWIPATTDGRVERIAIRPGAVVAPETVVIELSNPEIEQAALEASFNLEAAEARFSNRRVEVERNLLEQRATLASTVAQLANARLQADADKRLADRGLVSALQLQQSYAARREHETKYAIEQERLELAIATVDAQLAVEQAEVDRLRTLHELRQEQVDDFTVRAGIHGVLQQVPLEEGQRVTAGTNLARVGDPTTLTAELKIPETQARDIQVGQKASINTRHSVIPGRVARIDPAVENGTVAVDVTLEGELPRGARPDLTVEGMIELDRLGDAVFVGRPVLAQEYAVVSVFRVEADGAHAARTRVGLGRASISAVEVLEGLQPGDRIIVSDMSMWDSFDRVRID